MTDVFDFDSHGPDGRFLKGNPGGPGRPRKAVKAAANALDGRLAEAADDLYEVALGLARTGNERMLKMLLERLWPVGQSRPIEMAVPEIKRTHDLLPVMAKVTNAIFSGDASTQESAAAARVLKAHCEAIQTIDHEERLIELEAEYRKQKKG